jgi:hypothetical protein
MNHANEWLSYVAVVTALLALTVSVASFFLSVASYKRQGADIVAFYYMRRSTSVNPTVRLKVINRGLVTVPVITIWVIVRHGLLVSDQQRLEPPYANDWQDEELPPLTTKEFEFNVTGGHLPPPADLRRRLALRLVLGNGKHVRAERF